MNDEEFCRGGSGGNGLPHQSADWLGMTIVGQYEVRGRGVGRILDSPYGQRH